MAAHAAYGEEKENANTASFRLENPNQEKFARPRHRWKDNFTIALESIGWMDVEQIYLAEEKR